MNTNIYLRPFKLIVCCLVLAWGGSAYSAEQSINLDNWGLKWGMEKAKFKLEYCSKIYEYTETCKIKTAPRNLAHNNFYLLDFNPQNKLAGFRYISKKLNEENTLKLLSLIQKQFSAQYKPFSQKTPDLAKANFLDCVALGKCEDFALNISGKDSARIEVGIAPANIPPFDIDLNTQQQQLTTGIVYIRYENSELGKISKKIKEYKFIAKNMKWDDFLNPSSENYNLQLPYSPEEFNLSWGMSPQDMLKLGIVCYEIFKFYVCSPVNLSDFIPTLYTFSGHKNLGLAEFSLFHDIPDDELGTQGEAYFKQIINNLLKKYKGSAAAKAPQYPAFEFCVAGMCSQESATIHLNGNDETGGTIGLQRTINKKESKSNIVITYTKYLTEEQKKEMASK